MRLRIFLKLMVFCWCLTAIADIPIAVQPNPPSRYTVQRGDTLWGIAGKFLQRPWQWPYIWQSNPQIRNPHLIYPGDEIVFSYSDGQPRASLAEDRLFYPRLRETSAEEAIKLIPIDIIAPFLVSPRIVEADTLEEAPYILEFDGQRLIAGSGDKIYVRAIEAPETLSYSVYRAGKTYRAPESDEVLGHEALYIASATLQRSGDPAILTIDEAHSEIRRGDRLLPNTEKTNLLNFFPKAPTQSVSGTILSVMNGVSQIGQYDVVVIDLGHAAGLEPGHVLEALKAGREVTDRFSRHSNDRVRLPDEAVGVLMVFRVFERLSYALVMNTERPLHLHDKVRTPE